MNYNLVQIEEDKAPSIFSKENSSRVSQKYNHFNTTELLDAARDSGWLPYKYGQRKRKQSSLLKGLTVESAPHFICMKPASMLEPSIFDGGPNNYSAVYPSLLLINSHDGSGGLNAELGIIEGICKNGSIIVADNMGNISWKHLFNNSLEKIKESLQHLLSYAPWIIKVRDFLSKISVSENQAINLAERTIDLRFDGEKYSVDPKDIIKPHFYEQSSLSVYSVFQSIQRSLVRGGDFKVTNKKNLDGVRTGIYKRSPYRKARQIKSFSTEREINKNLWLRTVSWLKELNYEIPSN